MRIFYLHKRVDWVTLLVILSTTLYLFKIPALPTKFTIFGRFHRYRPGFMACCSHVFLCLQFYLAGLGVWFGKFCSMLPLCTLHFVPFSSHWRENIHLINYENPQKNQSKWKNKWTTILTICWKMTLCSCNNDLYSIILSESNHTFPINAVVYIEATKMNEQIQDYFRI